MARATLELTYGDLLQETGGYLGWGTNPDGWTQDQRERIERCVAAGIRQYIYPVRRDGGTYSWSWLNNQTTEIETEAGTADYPLPDNFGGGVTEVNLRGSVLRIWPAERLRKEADIRPQFGDPVAAAILPVFTPEEGQGWMLKLYPVPVRSFTISVSGHGIFDLPTAVTDYLPGGAQHSDGYVESCLAVAELHQNDGVAGQHKQRFMEILGANIALDAEFQPAILSRDPDSDYPARGGGMVSVEYITPDDN